MNNSVQVLFNGYSHVQEPSSGVSDDGPCTVKANCSCVLITGSSKVIVDTMTAWDKELILEALDGKGINPDEIDFVVSTHGHSDHIGNNNLFLNAKHIVGFCFSFKDQYYLHPFDQGIPYEIADGIKVIPTPGHTADDVSVVVESQELGTVVIAGDIFEREEDIDHPEIWRDEGGSTNPELQERSRSEIIKIADYIVPGHGPMFKVSEAMRNQMIPSRKKN